MRVVTDDPNRPQPSGVFSRSPTIAELLTKVEQVAETDTQVLVLGETGVGKGVLAQTIHNMSSRRERDFIAVNCGALPPGLVESELFGHEKGAFTGAVARRSGFFERAHEGTLFLDEIGDLPLEAQRVLLHVLDGDRLTRVGGKASIRVDVRIIAATNRDLRRAIRDGTFREDLYYRLSAFPLVLPPLRERREDIPLLATHFVREHAQRLQRSVPSLSAEALAHLQGYAWPGNVRELAHWMERAVIVCEGERIALADVLAIEDMGLSPPSASPVVQEVEERDKKRPRAAGEDEQQRIVAALERTNGMVSGDRGAARLLGMSVQTLRYRMRKYGIKRPKKSS
ncbi:MAG: sigma 54-interacting transcriptional regulator [Gemmatimonadota bacterium]|nr:sigma 54-interacting transcriptional regulator [Gemmatimonadota bacterium]